MSAPPVAAPCEVRACRFVLVDDQGRDRAILEMGKGEPNLLLIGSNGRVRVQLGILDNGTTRLFLEGADLESFASVSADGHGSATVEFGGSARRIRAASNLPTSDPSVILTDDGGRIVGRLP